MRNKKLKSFIVFVLSITLIFGGIMSKATIVMAADCCCGTGNCMLGCNEDCMPEYEPYYGGGVSFSSNYDTADGDTWGYDRNLCTNAITDAWVYVELTVSDRLFGGDTIDYFTNGEGIGSVTVSCSGEYLLAAYGYHGVDCIGGNYISFESFAD